MQKIQTKKYLPTLKQITPASAQQCTGTTKNERKTKTIKTKGTLDLKLEIKLLKTNE